MAKIYIVNSRHFAGGKPFKLRDMQNERDRLIKQQQRLQAKLKLIPNRIDAAQAEIDSIGTLLKEIP